MNGKRTLAAAAATFLTAITLYVCRVTLQAYRSIDPLLQTMTAERTFQYDPELGARPIPHSQSSSSGPTGLVTTIKFDSRGFRIPATVPFDRPLRHPLMITFGCSYTFGSHCQAEDTYPALIEKTFGGTVLNAGVSGSGLADMLRLGERLIPRYKPDFCVVQFSDWLIQRSTEPVYPAVLGWTTRSSFAKTVQGQIYLRGPDFQPASTRRDVRDYLPHSRSPRAMLRFFYRYAFPVLVRDDVHRLRVQLRGWGRRNRAPLTPEEVAAYAYGEFYKLCTQNHSKMLIVILKTPSPVMIHTLQDAAPGAALVFAQERMKDGVHRDPDEYFKRYMFWKGNPLSLVDCHPNPVAHRIIAEEVSRVIRKL